MPFNGSGVYTPSGADFPAVSGTTILSAKYNNVINDLAAGLSTALCKDGQQVATANQPMGGFKHTNVADAAARNQYATWGQMQDGVNSWCGTSGGSANAQTIAPSPGINSYVAGMSFEFTAGFTNTGPMTLNVNGKGAVTCQTNPGSAMITNQVTAGLSYRATHQGTVFLLEAIGIDPVSSFSPISSVALNDEFQLFDQSAGYNSARAVPEYILKTLALLTVVGAPDVNTDQFLIYNIAAGTVRRATLPQYPATTGVAGTSRFASAAEILAGASSTIGLTPGQFAANVSIGGSKISLKLPGGYMINAGATVTSGAGFVADTYQTAFASFAYVVAVPISGAPLGMSAQLQALSTAGFQIATTNPAYVAAIAHWIAFGL